MIKKQEMFTSEKLDLSKCLSKFDFCPCESSVTTNYYRLLKFQRSWLSVKTRCFQLSHHCTIWIKWFREKCHSGWKDTSKAPWTTKVTKPCLIIFTVHNHNFGGDIFKTTSFFGSKLSRKMRQSSKYSHLRSLYHPNVWHFGVLGVTGCTWQGLGYRKENPTYKMWKSRKVFTFEKLELSKCLAFLSIWAICCLRVIAVCQDSLVPVESCGNPFE